jgi:hypothetical protein
MNPNRAARVTKACCQTARLSRNFSALPLITRSFESYKYCRYLSTTVGKDKRAGNNESKGQNKEQTTEEQQAFRPKAKETVDPWEVLGVHRQSSYHEV